MEGFVDVFSCPPPSLNLVTFGEEELTALLLSTSWLDLVSLGLCMALWASGVLSHACRGFGAVAVAEASGTTGLP